MNPTCKSSVVYNDALNHKPRCRACTAMETLNVSTKTPFEKLFAGTVSDFPSQRSRGYATAATAFEPFCSREMPLNLRFKVWGLGIRFPFKGSIRVQVLRVQRLLVSFVLFLH